jgi:hypothetical protein
MTEPKASDLLTLPVVWEKVNDGFWRARINDHECLLRMNNFPEEPLYTITAGGSSVDVDDAPAGWKIKW